MNKENIGYSERSLSKRLMDRVVLAVYGSTTRKAYLDYSIWMRSLDNEVDEGTSFSKAEEIIQRHKQIVCGREKPRQEEDLENRLGRVLELPLGHIARDQNKKYLLLLLEYFCMDLKHRRSLLPFSKVDLERHIEGGFPACMGSIVTILCGNSIQHPGFVRLLRTHGMAEPLGDITEDLERGFIPHSREDGANWVDNLKVGFPIPASEIDNYVVSRRAHLARKMFKLAPWAAIEIPSMVGSLMALEYMRRALRLSRRRYCPEGDVIFAKYRIGD